MVANRGAYEQQPSFAEHQTTSAFYQAHRGERHALGWVYIRYLPIHGGQGTNRPRSLPQVLWLVTFAPIFTVA
jgi:hypothetical protein